MSARSSSLLGYGLYFIDVMACLLFCITLILMGARFGHEVTAAVDLPRAQGTIAAGSDFSGPSIVLRQSDGATRIYFDDESVTLEQLETRLRAAPPRAVVVRAEETALSSVIALAHAAGVSDIQLAYELERGGGVR